MNRLLLVLVVVAACTRPGEERALGELEVGAATDGGLSLFVDGGLAAVRELKQGTPSTALLWSGAPHLELTVVSDQPLELDVTFFNALPDAELAGSDGTVITDGATTARITTRSFHVSGPSGEHRLRLSTPDADGSEPYRVVAMADIQTGLPIVNEVFERIARVSDVRFVIAMGDITERGEVEEYDLFEEQLGTLPVPFYTTLGNHELWAPPERWLARYGRSSFQFEFANVQFTFADSGNVGFDPIVHQWIDEWLEVAHDQLHLLLTHVPPVEPSGVRAGSFRSQREAHDLIARMAAGGVDLALYGHIHTLMTYEHAGIPAWISGGGGATPEKWDGIGRHFLTIDLDGSARTADVGVVRVDL